MPQLDIRRWPILKNCFCPTKLVFAFIFSFTMLFYRTSCRHAELHLHGCLHRRVSPHAIWVGATEILQLPIQHLGLCGEWMFVRLAGQPNLDTNRPNCVDDQTKPCTAVSKTFFSWSTCIAYLACVFSQREKLFHELRLVAIFYESAQLMELHFSPIHEIPHAKIMVCHSLLYTHSLLSSTSWTCWCSFILMPW